MRRLCIAACLVMLIGLGGATDKRPDSTAKVERGKYLVENVGLCGDCHTPHDEKGQPIAGQNLQGATIAFSPTVPVPVWAGKAPALAGLSEMNDADAVAFLSTGETTKGIRARPPMPAYRFSRADAEAVLMYLRSLRPAAEKKAAQ